MKLIPNSILYFVGFCSSASLALCWVFYNSNKPMFCWTIYIGILLGVIVGILKWQNEIWKRIKNNIKINISCLMEYPIKGNGESTYRDTKNPRIIINNSGPITAISISVEIVTYLYNITENKIDYVFKSGFNNFEHAVSAEELKPFSTIEHNTIGVNGINLIAVYVVNINYHRKSDMKFFTLNEYFFTHNKKIYNNSEFKNNKNYKKIVRTVKSFNPNIAKNNEIKLTATTKQSWFMESNPSLLHRINNDGSVTFAGLPEIQSKSRIKGFPHLLVTPSRFKESGNFIKAEINGENIIMTVRYKVNNIGDMAALITEDGFTSIIEIPSGGKRYYSNTFEITRSTNNNKSLKEFINMIEMGKETPLITLNLLYRPKNENNKLYKVVVIYRFSINSVKLIKN